MHPSPCLQGAAMSRWVALGGWGSSGAGVKHQLLVISFVCFFFESYPRERTRSRAPPLFGGAIMGI
jgi:hypothetical protein